MNKTNSKRKRSSNAYALDQKVEETCKILLRKGRAVSARSVAVELGKSPSSITRDPIRSKIISEAKKQQQLIAETTKRQTKSSRAKDAEIIARQQVEIDKLKRQNSVLLYSHKALYNVIRETGGKEAFDRFLTTSMELRAEILKMGALSKLD